ncbi:hypothetical protein AKO1_005634 [Acrasis kona]|uniref:SAP domain-containing protein n=1 Tax=Acrasis kona TaxID=1008807 RepID=A0AAW2YJ82_9EUKA
MATIFNRTDFAALRRNCGTVRKQPSAAQFKQTIESGNLSDLQVAELKEIAKYLKTMKGFTDVKTSGTKQSLLDEISKHAYSDPNNAPTVEYRAKPWDGKQYVKVSKKSRYNPYTPIPGSDDYYMQRAAEYRKNIDKILDEINAETNSKRR